jgi:hypothetical protein
MVTTYRQGILAVALVCALALLGAIAPANAGENKPYTLFILTGNLGTPLEEQL